MKILQFGAGNIGRGFIGHLFSEAGYEIIFVERDETLVQLLNSRKNYPLYLLDAYRKEIVEVSVGGVSAVSIRDEDSIASAFSEVQCVGTAVGIENYPAIAPLIARGIEKRKERHGAPLDIYLCENDLSADVKMREALRLYLDADLQGWMENYVGLVRVIVARMVPGRSSQNSDSPFLVADAYREFPYDESARRGEVPRLMSVRPVRHFGIEFQRKIYIYNLGHAVLAYLGYLRGYRYVHQGFGDPWINEVFGGALGETTTALLRKYPEILDPEEHKKVLEDVHIRFGNPLLQDPVFRVARDPIRKLGPKDRLLGSAFLCLEQEVFPKYIASSCAGAFLYDWPEDSQAVKLQKMIREKGIETVLGEVATVDSRSDLGKIIIGEYYRLKDLVKGVRS
ncbi:MAG: hypothetical protein ACUVQZ_07100 [Candidatus Caldatribacteriaceae bacterium]